MVTLGSTTSATLSLGLGCYSYPTVAKRRLAVQERVNNSAGSRLSKGLGTQWLPCKNSSKGASVRMQQFKGRDLLQKFENSCMVFLGPACALPPQQSPTLCGISVESHHKNRLHKSTPLGHWGQCGLRCQSKQDTLKTRFQSDSHQYI